MRILLARLVLAALIAALYAFASFRNGFIYDDQIYIIEAQPVRSLGDVLDAFRNRNPGDLPYYRPVVMLSLWVQKAIHGNTPAPYHIFNAIIAGLLVLAASSLLLHTRLRVPPPLALLGATLLAVHPVASSCVYPADSGRETLLPALCMILALDAWLRPGRLRYAGSLIALTLALFGKEQAVMLPLLLTAAECLNLTDRPPARRWLRLIPAFALLALYLLLRRHIFAGADITLVIHTQPAAPLWAALYALQTALLPAVAFAYEPPLATWLSWPRLLLALACLAALVAALFPGGPSAARPLLSPSPRGPSAARPLPSPSRPILFWSLWWLLSLAPTAGFIQQEVAFDERYVFVSLLAIVGLAALALARHWHRPRIRRVSLALGTLIALTFLAISLHRSRTFATPAAYYTQWLRTNPRSPQALHGVAQIHLAAQRTDDAIALLQAATALNPAYANAHNTLAQAYEARRQPDLAHQSYLAALAAAPTHLEALNNLAVLLARSGRPQDALPLLRTALAAHPQSAQTFSNLGGVMIGLNRLDRATRAYARAVSLDPTLLEAQAGLGGAYAAQGDAARARTHLAAALALATAQHRPAEAAILRDRLSRLP